MCVWVASALHEDFATQATFDWETEVITPLPRCLWALSHVDVEPARLLSVSFDKSALRDCQTITE